MGTAKKYNLYESRVQAQSGGEWRHSPRQPAVGSVHTAHLHLNP